MILPPNMEPSNGTGNITPSNEIESRSRPEADVSLLRPGVSAGKLAEAGIRHIETEEASKLVGYNSPGILIPYRNLDGSSLLTIEEKPFYRLRLDSPTPSTKYLSPRSGGAQVYFPPGLPKLLTPGCTIHIVEGEFKALALVEAGFPCVGVGGISSACKRTADRSFELLPDLAKLVAQVRPAALAFVGDSDTALILDFSREACKIAKVARIPVLLPRIPLDGPKAPDDLRAIHGTEFPRVWNAIMDRAEHIGVETPPSALAVRLLRREADALDKLTGDARDRASGRLIRMAAGMQKDPVEFEAVVTVAMKFLGLTRASVIKAIKVYHGQEERRRREGIIEGLAEKAEPVLLFDGTYYYRRANDGSFERLCREDARLHLGMLGLSQHGTGGSPSEVDSVLHRIQHKHRIHFAGPICGRPVGVHQEGTLTLLATRGPKWIEGKAGSFPTIARLIANLLGASFGDPFAAKQLATFCSWLKLAREAVRNNHAHCPGQVLGLVGPKDCGKSFVQFAIITPALGGRVVDPTLWFTGKSSFNSELWGAEHLGFGDKSLGENGRERAHLRDELKRVVASTEYPCHGKFTNAFTLRHIWRITLSANDDSESAESLPPLDASFADKIIYLKCYPPETPFFDLDAPTGREDFGRTIAAELPAFLYEIDNAEIPVSLRKARFGVREFHHPHIVDLIENATALAPLSEVVEAWIDRWEPHIDNNARTSRELFSEIGDELRGVTSSPAVLGKQLARLAETATWRGRLTRNERRIGDRQKQTVWQFRRAA